MEDKKMARSNEKLRFWNKGRQRGSARGVPAVSQQALRPTGTHEIRKPCWPIFGEIGASYRQRDNPLRPNPTLAGIPDRASDGAAKDPPGYDYDKNPNERQAQTKPQVRVGIPLIRGIRGSNTGVGLGRSRGQRERNKHLSMFPPSAYKVYSGPTRPVDEGEED